MRVEERRVRTEGAGAHRTGPAPPSPPGPFERLFLEWEDPPPASPVWSAAALGAGLVGAVALGDVIETGAAGIGFLVAALAAVLAVLPAAWPAGRVLKRDRRIGALRVNRTGAAFILLGLGLAAVPAVRDAPWVNGLCLALLVPVMSYALSGGRSWAEVLGGGLALPVACGRMLPWAGRGLAATASLGRHRTIPIARTAVIAVALLAVFGALFAGADAAFRELFGSLTPGLSVGSTVLRVIVGAAVALIVLAGAFVLHAPPPLRLLVPAAPRRPAGRWTWAVPIVALDLLFLAFCTVQAVVLLATDKDRILRATGLTYAEYARQGFFQLVVVTLLVLAVVAVAIRYAPRRTAGDRALVRILLGLLCALTLVVVAVALRRLFLYEEAFGWTRLRLWVHAFEIWLGVVVVLIAIAGIRLRARWLPRAVAACGAAGLIGLSLLNPDAFIAEHNSARFEKTGKIDLGYVSGLSADAVPALDRLPEPQRTCALAAIGERLDHDEARLGTNLARHRARETLREMPAPPAQIPAQTCPEP